MSEGYGFFYGLETSHFVKIKDEFYQIQGFGITINPKKRLLQYSDHSGTDQEFHVLYFGPIAAIKTLENMVKQLLSSESHMIHGQKVEWVNPTSEFDKDDLISLVEQIISSENLLIKKIKDIYLPFDNSAIHKKLIGVQLLSNPDKYLEQND
jgi:hypothetical protein